MRSAILTIVERVGLLLVSPLWLAWRSRLLPYPAVGQILSLAPGSFGMLVRRAWYHATLAECGERLTVEFGSVIHKQSARLGNDCYIGEYNRIGIVDMGDDFMSSSHVAIVSGMHVHGFSRRDIPMRLQPSRFDRVAIGPDVWVGAGAVIGASIASHSIVAAGAVVTKRFDEWQILGGVPAKPIGSRP